MGKSIDVQVTGGGTTIVMVKTLTKEAASWVKENVATESWQWLDNAFACEPRMVNDLIEGMRNDGLEVTCG